ncbi:unnamed protein product [Rotaria sordida]|uniref:Uncharacterized protein n=1 Tax=Rotaria sordida TaxID=392033 RepID=A0A814T1J1_9BILA|nr:unnamed protein product [Rotaria sordida]CAF1152099.1 unnamed protein product [Rotaria sordida]
MFNVDMPKRLPLSSATLNIKPLNSSALSSFLMEDTVETIFNRLMIEEWKMSSSFDGYYNSCAPATCTYRIVKRMDHVYVVAIVGGLFGGLATSLRLIVPVIAKLFYWIILHQRRRRANIRNQQLDRHEGK